MFMKTHHRHQSCINFHVARVDLLSVFWYKHVLIRFHLSLLSLFITLGHNWYGRGQGSFGHHPDWRQLHEHRQGRHVGQERLRQHCQVSPVPADCQRRRGHCCFRRCLRHRGQPSQGSNQLFRNLSEKSLSYFLFCPFTCPFLHFGMIIQVEIKVSFLHGWCHRQ